MWCSESLFLQSAWNDTEYINDAMMSDIFLNVYGLQIYHNSMPDISEDTPHVRHVFFGQPPPPAPAVLVCFRGGGWKGLVAERMIINAQS